MRNPELFTVVLEQFQTDSADYADILLPATTFLEHTDLYLSYGHYHVQLARPALPAPGETKPNVEVFRLLAARMGFTDPEFSDTDDDMIRATLASGHPYLDGITLERLEREGSVRLNLPEPYLPFAEGAATPSGKFDLAAEELAYQPPVESRLGDGTLRAAYPLEMVSSKDDDGLNSTFGNRPEVIENSRRLYMHSTDAANRNIGDGDRVRVFNDRGSCVYAAVVNGFVRPGVVRAPAVAWHKHALTGDAVNVLTSERLTDKGNGPTFFSCLVQVEKCGD
jgi:anaerobic selenocysteine-containing dehydrogenase